MIVVPPLSFPGEDVPTRPEAIVHFEAVDLFVDRATSAYSGFELTPDNAPAVATLCRELDGVPLAIELAAARVRALSPGEICDNLTRRLQILNTGYRDAAERHQSLRACLEWSFRLCTDLEQQFWVRSAVFAGGFDLESAAVICGADDLPSHEILDLVSALIDQSIIVAEPAGSGQTRYRMLADIREFGIEQGEKAGELSGLQERHASWFAQLAREFDEQASGPDQPVWLRRMRFEHANLRAALNRMSEATDAPGASLDMARRLDLFWSACGWLDEARHWLELGLAAGGAPSRERALAMAVAARFAALQSDRARARTLLDQGYELAKRIGDSRVLGVLLVPDAMLSVWNGAPDDAAEQADRAAAMLRTAGDLTGELRALFVAGVCHSFAGTHVDAVARFKRCIDRADEVGERHMKALAVNGLGEQELRSDNPAGAAALFRSALGIKRELGDRLGIAVGLDSLGRVAVAEGGGQRAAVLLGAAEGIWDEVGMSETGNMFAYAPSRTDGLERARKLLGKERFRDLFARGSRLGVDEAVSFALSDTPTVDAPVAQIQASPLTRRELEVADLVADGLSNPEIAARLVISVRTAQGHVENILRKLGFNSRSLIAAWVTERRIVQGSGMAAQPRPGA